ncbi:MAG: lytic transglycosylase domain-containing protein [Steroidobacteraceae bacterium]
MNRPSRHPFSPLWLALAFLASLQIWAPARADQQRDPALQGIVAHAIAQAQCFADRFDSAVWYRMMGPRLRAEVPDAHERVAILKAVYCETHRPGQIRLPPGLVMALIDVESGFNRWAVSSTGAVGLMQVMPFWPVRLGMPRYELTHIESNIEMGCAILRYYLRLEHHDYSRALAHYNGSIGRLHYADLVLTRWATRWRGADDLGWADVSQPVSKPRG